MINTLTITINSFSFKKSIPYDKSGNGGGFVFDCRAIPNPGRVEKYKDLTGLDKEIIEFLDNEPEMQQFLKNIFMIIDQSVSNYLLRNFKNLMVNFGCTGGQHRSVYSAEKLAEHLKNTVGLLINIQHIELKRNNKLKKQL